MPREEVLITRPDGTQDRHNIEVKPLTMIAHTGGLKIEVPGRVEITPETTINLIKNLTEGEWRWNSTSEIFKTAWHKVFTDRDGTTIPIPATVALLNTLGMDMRHVAGMIILFYEAVFNNKKIFLKTPEAYLHPYMCSNLADMIIFLGGIGNPQAG